MNKLRRKNKKLFLLLIFIFIFLVPPVFAYQEVLENNPQETESLNQRKDSSQESMDSISVFDYIKENSDNDNQYNKEEIDQINQNIKDKSEQIELNREIEDLPSYSSELDIPDSLSDKIKKLFNNILSKIGLIKQSEMEYQELEMYPSSLEKDNNKTNLSGKIIFTCQSNNKNYQFAQFRLITNNRVFKVSNQISLDNYQKATWDIDFTEKIAINKIKAECRVCDNDNCTSWITL